MIQGDTAYTSFISPCPEADLRQRRLLAGSSPDLVPIVRQFMDKKLTADPWHPNPEPPAS
jgi:hypothetical protein